MSVNLRSLLAKLNNHSRQALEEAVGLCVTRSQYDVELEHWVLKLAEMPNTDLQRVLRYYDIDHERLVHDLTRALDLFKTGNTRTPLLSAQLTTLIREAWVLASIDFGAPRIRSGHLLLTLLEDRASARLALGMSMEFRKIPADELRRLLLDLVAGSGEDRADVRGADDARPLPAVRIFLSYRRHDASGYAVGLADRLRSRFGREHVLMNIETIEPGLDFVEAIEQVVGSCDVLLALMGPAWLQSTEAQGRRHLDNPADVVRLEIATALARDIRVIPVLVDGARMPDAEELPAPLQPLAQRNALEISDTRWEHDVDGLMEKIARRARRSPPAS
jgi:hypothetical protein